MYVSSCKIVMRAVTTRAVMIQHEEIYAAREKGKISKSRIEMRECYNTAPYPNRNVKCTGFFFLKEKKFGARHITMRSCIFPSAMSSFAIDLALVFFSLSFLLFSTHLMHIFSCTSPNSLPSTFTTVVDAMRLISFTCNATYNSVWPYKIYSIQ